jgi:hypothetical protein
MRKPFVSIVGRNVIYDRVKQTTVQLLPIWLINAIRWIKKPLTLLRTKVLFRYKVHQANPLDCRWVAPVI